MKTKLIVFFALAFVSCQNDNTLPTSSLTDQDLTPWKEATQIPFENYKAYFRSLTPNQKYSIWKVKFEFLSLNNEWNENQLGFIKTMQSMISPEFFSELLPRSEDQRLVDKALEAFTEEDVYLSFFIPHTFKTREEVKEFARLTASSGARLSAAECECYYSISCGLYVDCIEEDCQESLGGCGIVGTTNCDGKCDAP